MLERLWRISKGTLSVVLKSIGSKGSLLLTSVEGISINNIFGHSELVQYTRGYQKVLSLTWKEPEIWIYSALFFNVVPFQLHTLVPSSYPVINTRSVEVNILVP